MQAASTSASGERIEVVDVLRAYSLFGIIITHSVTGFLAGQPPSPDFMLFSPLDRVVSNLENLLTCRNFFTIFSLFTKNSRYVPFAQPLANEPHPVSFPAPAFR